MSLCDFCERGIRETDVLRHSRLEVGVVDRSENSRCSCGQETSPEVMSKASLRLSMGVVLQLLFYEDVSTGPCGHKLFRNRVRVLDANDSLDPLFPSGQHSHNVHVGDHEHLRHHEVSSARFFHVATLRCGRRIASFPSCWTRRCSRSCRFRTACSLQSSR